MNSVDKLTLDKTLKIYKLIIFIRCIFNNKNMHFNYDNTVSTKEGVIFGERLIYLRSYNTRCFLFSYGLIISSVFSDNEEKWLFGLLR